MIDPAPTDAERFPHLSEAGATLLKFMREHPNAPRYRNHSGHRLLEADLAELRAHADEVAQCNVDPRADLNRAWQVDFVQRALRHVPYYRRYGSMPTQLAHLATIDRGTLARDVAAFVPDDLPLDRLINFRTTGLTGQPLLIASHPLVAARYLAFHQRALRRFGIELQSGPGTVGVVLVGWQQRCFTYVSVTPLLGDCGLAKINLHQDDWRDSADQGQYLDALVPEIITGDPLSLGVLLELPFNHRPRALMSTSMSLTDGLRLALEARFQCPVLDLYSLNEVGPVACFDPRLGAHVLLQHRLVVEIVDADGEPLGGGERGEVTLTGGFNFCMPLLRYRTGDHAALEQRDGEWVLVGLSGRAPVRFRRDDGIYLNNIDVTHALKPHTMAQYSLVQRADASFDFSVYGPMLADMAGIETALKDVLGENCVLRTRHVREVCDKVVQYRSDFPG